MTLPTQSKKDQSPSSPENPVTVVNNSGRDENTGRFIAGNTSGRGRPVKEIETIQDAIELYVRKNISTDMVLRVVQATFADALEGDAKKVNQARKLIFDYFLGKPKPAEEGQDKDTSVVIKIENATFAKQKDETPLDAEYTEVN